MIKTNCSHPLWEKAAMFKMKVLVGAAAFTTALAVPLWTVAGVDLTSGVTPVSEGVAAAPAADPPDSSGPSAMPGMHDESNGSPAVTDWKAMDKQMAARDKSFPAATKGTGAQVLEPKVLADGTKQFDLTAKVTKWEVEPGKTVDAWAYNGTVPGPTMHVNLRDKVRVVLHNQLPESTVIHWHGLPVTNDMDGVSNITQEPVAPGASYAYTFTASEQSVGWYHSHHDGTKQVTNGLFGAFLIDQVPVPAGVKVSQEIPMMVQDAGTIGMTINGKSFPATAPVRARRGDWIKVHYFNAGTQSHPMHLHRMAQLVIAKDGYPLPQPYRADTVNVAPGERYTVLIHATELGKWAWHCHIFTHSEGSQGMFGLFTELIVT